MSYCVRLLATVTADVNSRIRDSLPQGQSLTLPIGVLFYGPAAPTDLAGNGINRYLRRLGYRFEAEIADSFIAARGNKRYNRGSQTGCSVGNGATVLPEIRKAEPALGARLAPGLEFSEPSKPSPKRLDLGDSPGAGASHAREHPAPHGLPLRSC
ncbi:MAG: hypothetical protein ACREJ5_07510 [Geminicoccaceae bacterium]